MSEMKELIDNEFIAWLPWIKEIYLEQVVMIQNEWNVLLLKE